MTETAEGETSTMVAETARVRDVSVEVHSIRDEVREELSRLARAREAVTTDDAVLSGTPCIEATPIPAHDIAEMLANGDGIGAVLDAWLVLTEEQIEVDALYARAYPCRTSFVPKPRPRTMTSSPRILHHVNASSVTCSFGEAPNRLPWTARTARWNNGTASRKRTETSG